MANLARREMGFKGTVAYVQPKPTGNRGTSYRQGNVVYGCFGAEAISETDRFMENKKSMLRESVKAGILFGLKIFGSGIFGMLLTQFILESLNVSVRCIPAFALVLLWIAIAGSCFCLTGLFRNGYEELKNLLFLQEERR